MTSEGKVNGHRTLPDTVFTHSSASAEVRKEPRRVVTMEEPMPSSKP